MNGNQMKSFNKKSTVWTFKKYLQILPEIKKGLIRNLNF
jgi:hypothetical protein